MSSKNLAWAASDAAYLAFAASDEDTFIVGLLAEVASHALGRSAAQAVASLRIVAIL